MKVIEPVRVTDAILVNSTVAEDEYPAWAPGTTYALGARAIRAHRIYESALGGNVGHDPIDPATSQWIDLGPTNRWAMFEEALGAVTSATGTISVALAPGVVDAVALLDVAAATVRVQVNVGASTIYDETRATGVGDVMMFLDLPDSVAAQVVVTVTGSGAVSIGTLLLGNLLDLGETETSPTVGIVDYSKRTTDDFGNTTVLERDWAKTMSLRTKLDTANADEVQRRVALLRARPALWIGEEGYASLAVYGFYKNFSIDLALPSISYCSFTIEGLGA